MTPRNSVFHKKDGTPIEALGERWLVTASRGSEKHSGSYLVLRFAQEFPHKNIDLSFYRESGWTDFVKGLSIATECQTGDKPFDDLVYINTDSPVIHRLLRSDSVLRELIAKIIAHDEVLELRIKGGRLSLKLKTFSKNFVANNKIFASITKDDLLGYISAYEELAKSLVRIRNILIQNWGYDRFDWDRKGIRKGILLNLISAGLFAVAVYLFSLTIIGKTYGSLTDPELLLGYGVLPSFALIALSLFIGLFWMKGSARSASFVLPFLLSQFFVIPSLLFSGAKIYNVQNATLFKRVEAPIYSAEVVKRQSKHSSHYVCVIQSQNPMHTSKVKREDLQVNWCDYLNAAQAEGKKSYFTYEIYKGNLGFYWYPQREIIQRPQQ